MTKEKFKKNYILLAILFTVSLLATLISFGFVLAQSCPSSTTVTGTSVNFVGEITDMGGDTTVTAWFEYGQSTGYGQTSSQKVLSQLGIYCVTVSNLSPCTTYHYRAVAQNSAGTSYGEDKTFTTTCGATVDIKANGSDGPVTITYGSSASLSWTSNNANSCQASGDWSGTKAISGSETTANLTSSKTYTLTCTGSGGSASDSVTVNVGSLSLSVSLSASPSSGCSPLSGVDLTGSVSGSGSGDITYFFDCTNDGNWEKIITSSSNSYTAYDVCNYSSVGNYTAKVRVERQAVSAENTAQINVSSCYSSPSIDLKANNSGGTITIPYNSSATLSWTSTNSNSCTASGDWSGSKSTYGSESTGNLISSKSYTLTCSGSGGSASDSVFINVTATPTLTVSKLVRNLSDGTSFLDLVDADPGEAISFFVQITAGNVSIQNIVLKDTLPEKMTFQGNLKVDGVSFTDGNIATGLNMGDLVPNQSRTITFDAVLSGSDQFAFGETRLVNTVLVSSVSISGSDTATVNVKRSAVAGATTVSTGLTNNIFVDSFIIPLVIALFLVWLLKSNIIKFEQWLDGRKREYQKYKSNKLFQLKAKKIRIKEFIRKL